MASKEAGRAFIAASPVMREKQAILNRVAATDSSVLITGESGVGKEVFAERIHFLSKRREGPFIRVNCAAMPDNLAESELFGHVKGAFTGSTSTRAGRFEAANGGTLLLDEIADMSLALQAKILRVIQERALEKVGSDEAVAVDVRILASTNRNLTEMVAQGAFRGDLYYRLNVVPIYVPPLRERPEDILELASYFLKRRMEQGGKQFSGFSGEAVQAMLSYRWPGNVRELQNCVERACVFGAEELIGRRDLFPALETGGERERGAKGLKTAMNVFKAYYVRKVLEENNWNVSKAAQVLEIQRTYLSRLVSEFHIGANVEA